MIKTFVFVYLAASFASCAYAQDFEVAKKIISNGNSKGAVSCMTCHQENGAGNAAAGFPQLAGMNFAYFSKQIYDFQSLRRVNPIMQPIAKGLNESEIKSLAAYFESLPTVPLAAYKDDPSTHANFELGQTIAKKGLWAKGVPSCFSCHGPSGQGVGENFPGITTQGKTYLVQQLQAWKKGSRKNDPNQLMAAVVKKLTQKEIDAVATYLSSGMTKEQK